MSTQPSRKELDQMRIENERYMKSHPELNDAVQEFVYAVLKQKPENVRDFAINFFTKPIPDSSS